MALIACSGEAIPDAELTALSTVPSGTVTEVFSYLVHGGPTNLAQCLRFVADTASAAGLDDYKVLVNVGEGGGQTVFHLHWHVLGGRFDSGKLARVLELETA